MTSNSITSIAAKAFSGLVNLQELDLDYNYISSIAPDAFTSLVSVQTLLVLLP